MQHRCIGWVMLILLLMSLTVRPAQAVDAQTMTIARGLSSFGAMFGQAQATLDGAGALPLAAINPIGSEGLAPGRLIATLLTSLTGPYGDLDDLAADLRARSGAYGDVIVTIGDVALTREGNRILVNLRISAERAVAPALWLDTDRLDIAGGALPLTLRLDAPLAFQFDLVETDPDRVFALQAPPAITVEALGDGPIASFRTQAGFLDVEISGTAALTARLTIGMQDPDGDGQITTGDWMYTQPTRLLTLSLGPEASAAAALDLASTPLPGADRPFVAGAQATIRLNDADFRNGLEPPTVDIGALAPFIGIDPITVLGGLHDLSLALMAAQSHNDRSLPLLRDRLSDTFLYAEPLIAYVRRLAEGLIQCGRLNADPPTGDVRDLPPGETTIYCQAITTTQPTQVEWQITNGQVALPPDADLLPTVGPDPTANVALTIVGPGTPQVSLTFVDPPVGDQPGEAHQVAMRFVSAQSLVASLRNVGGFALSSEDVRFDSATRALTYRLRASRNPAPLPGQLAFGDLLEADTGLTQLQPGATATAVIDPRDVTFDLTFGVLLGDLPDGTSPTSIDRFFVLTDDDPSRPEFSADAAIAATIDLTGRLGPLEVQVTAPAGLTFAPINANQPLQTLDLRAPDPPAPLPGGVLIPGALPVGLLLSAPQHTTLLTTNVRASTTLQVSSKIDSPARMLAQGTIGLSVIGGASDQISVALDDAYASRLRTFDIAPGQPRALLYQLIDQLDTLAHRLATLDHADLPRELETAFPLTNLRPRDLLQQLAEIRAVAAELRSAQPSTLQELERIIEARLQIPAAGLQLSLSDLQPGVTPQLVLRLGIGLCSAGNRQIPACESPDRVLPKQLVRLVLPLDAQRGLVGAAQGADLELEFRSHAQLDIAIPLQSDLQPLVLSSSRVDLRAGLAEDAITIPGSLGGITVAARGMLRTDAGFALTHPTPGEAIPLDTFITDLGAAFVPMAPAGCPPLDNPFQPTMACAQLQIGAPATADNFVPWGELRLLTTTPFPAGATEPPAGWQVSFPPELEQQLATSPLSLVELPGALEASLSSVGDALKLRSKLPFIGDQLDAGVRVVERTNDALVRPLKEVLNNLADSATVGALRTQLQAELFSQVSPVLLDGPDADERVSAEDIGVELRCGTASCADDALVSGVDDVRLTFLIGQGVGPTGTPGRGCSGPACVAADLPFDLGLPGLPLEIAGSLRAEAGWKLLIDFGLNRNGPYVVTGGTGHGVNPAEPELRVGASIGFREAPNLCDESLLGAPGGLDGTYWSDRCLKGRLGFVDVTLRDGNDKDGTTPSLDDDFSGVAILANLDLGSTAGPDAQGVELVSLAQISRIRFTPVIDNVVANLDVRIHTGLSGDTGGKLPSVLGTLHITWDLRQTMPSEVRFANLHLNPGGFVSSFLAPIVKEIATVTSPLQPIVDTLRQELPVVSEVSRYFGQGPVTLFRLMKMQSGNDLEMLDTFLNFVDFVNKVDGIQENKVLIALGNSPGAFTVDPQKAIGSRLPSEIAAELIDTVLDSRQGLLGEVLSDPTRKPDQLRFPFLDDSTSIFFYLLGQDISLVEFDFGTLQAEARIVVGGNLGFIPVGFTIEGLIGIEGRLVIGYDTYGLSRTIENGDASALLNGIYISDNIDSKGKDLPEIRIYGKAIATGFVGFNIGLASLSAGGRGGVGGYPSITIPMAITLNLGDTDGDGRLRIGEIAGKLDNPLCLFDEVAGRARAGLEVYAEAKVLGIGPEWSYTIAEVSLFDFEDNPCGNGDPPPPVLAGPKPGSPEVLLLQMGSKERRNARQVARDVRDESFTVRQMSAGVPACFNVTAFGVSQTYCGFSSIEADGDDGNDTVALLTGTAEDGTPIPFTAPALIFGGSGADQITGSTGADTLHGGADRDVITGGAGSDTITGDAGDDRLEGQIDDDRVDGGDGNDTIFGGPGADTLNGDAGDDTLVGGNGTPEQADRADTISGGSGNDRIFGDQGDDTIAGDSLPVCAADPAMTGNDVIGGGPGDDTIGGGPGDDFLRGDQGSDRLCGEGGADQLFGDQGDQSSPDDDHDRLEGGPEDDRLRGSGGDDDLLGGAGNDELLGDDGNDDLSGGLGDDKLLGGAGRDYLFGDDGGAVRPPGQADATSVSVNEAIGGADTIFGGDGDDQAHGEGGGDEIWGENGGDVLHGNGGNDLIRGGQGDDLLTGDGGDDRLFGESEADRLFGGTDNDLLRGGLGDDYAEGNSGADEIHGDAGEDDLIGGSSFAGAEDASLADGSGDRLFGGLDSDLLTGDNAQITRPGGRTSYDGTSIRQVLLFDSADADAHARSNDYLEGNAANDRLYGQGGNDTILGNAGDDYIEGNAGGDQIAGDEGQDDLVGGGAEPDLPDGDDQIWGGSDGAGLTGDFDVLAGDNARITRPLDLDGHWIRNSFNEAIRRTVLLHDQAPGDETPVRPETGGADTMFGEADDDLLFGQGGDDTMRGGGGDDYLEGNAAGDRMYGDTGQDDLIGGSTRGGHLDGSDRIWGGDGSVALESDHDVIIGDNGVIARPLDLLGRWRINSYDGSIRRQITLLDEVLIGDPLDPALSGADQIDGEAGNDLIFGGGAHDHARGGPGDDRIEGNAGNDLIAGDAGQDDLIGGTTAPGRIDGSDEIWGDNGQNLPAEGQGTSGAGLGTSANDHDVIAADNAMIDRPLLCGRWQVYAQNGSIARNVTLYEVAVVQGSVVVRRSDRAYGQGGDDRIYGQGGDDLVVGSDGDDYLEGNADHDTIEGGTGNDIIVGGTGRINGDGPGGVSGRLDGRDRISGGEGFDVIAGDNAILMRSVRDPAPPSCGTVGAVGEPLVVDWRWIPNSFNGGYRHEPRILLDLNSPDSAVVSGSDTISGGADDDFIYGQAGYDTLTGDDGDDLVEGNAGDDLISGGAGNDDLIGGTAAAGIYDDLADTIHGDAGHDVIAGDNALITRPLDRAGRWRSDALGATVRAIQLFDVARRGYTVDPRLSCEDFLYGDAGVDRLFGQGGDDLVDGGEGRDYMEGNAGADRLFGRSGRDALIGGGSDADGVVGSGRSLNTLVDSTDALDGGGDGDRVEQGNVVVAWP